MYTVKVLSEEDFDKLPYKHTKTSLGLADAKTGVAYVRDTGYNDITKETISHELDELMQTVSPHEEDGIRYKNLASLGGGAGAGILSSMVPALRPFQPLISAGVGAAVNKDKNYLQGAMQGFTGGGLGTGLGGGVFDAYKGVTQPGGTFGKALDAFVPGVERGITGFIQGIPGMGGYGGDPMYGDKTGKIAQWLQGSGGAGATGKTATMLGGGDAKPITGGAGSAQQFAKQMASQGGGTLDPKKGIMDRFNISDQLKKVLPSLAITKMGDMMAPKVETPDFSGIRSDLESKIQTGGEPIAKEAGMQELLRGLDPNAIPTGFLQGDRESEELLVENLKKFDASWKAIRPGADYKTDSEYQAQRQKIIDDSMQERIAMRDEQQVALKYNYMREALNLDQNQMNQYVQLAQLDLNQLMLEYGVDVETATRFKQMFADLGRMNMGEPDYGSGVDKVLAYLKSEGGTS